MSANNDYIEWMKQHPNIDEWHPYTLDLMEAYKAGYEKAMDKAAEDAAGESS